ncbi:MAG: hypothetical protein IKJ27_01030 [Clostridia bacterium]|nr:hypothetical protein [Clostridia bacterium]
MKIKKSNSGFFFSLLLSLLFNLEWTVPAWILLALHFWKGISVWWFAGSIILWVIFVALRIIVLGSLTRAGNFKDPPKENKNPYSKKGR